MGRETELQADVERTLAERVPEVEVLLAERSSPGLVRVVIDRPGGSVDLDLCERVTRELSALRDRYALEVSSPGEERPLTRPDHFRQAVGDLVAIRTDAPLDGRRRFSGRLLDAGDDAVEIDQDGHNVRIPYEAIRRSHLVFDPAGGRS
ncbi:MAG: ribosome maturation factor RimP [Gaiellales bacterium]